MTARVCVLVWAPGRDLVSTRDVLQAGRLGCVEKEKRKHDRDSALRWFSPLLIMLPYAAHAALAAGPAHAPYATYAAQAARSCTSW